MTTKARKFYAAHNGVAAVYDERGDAISFDTAAEASKHGDVVPSARTIPIGPTG